MSALSAKTDTAHESLARLVTSARAEGREHLLEHEGLEVAKGLGFQVPRHVLVKNAAEALALDASTLGTERAVVKIVSPRVLHKSAVHGVATVACERHSIADAVRDMLERLAAYEPIGCLVCEFIEHTDAPGQQLLLGMRWSNAFGAVVTLGLGGVDVETLTAATAQPIGVAMFRPECASPEALERALRATWWSPLLKNARCNPASVEVHVLEGAQRLLALAAQSMPQDLLELEFNPVVVTESGLIALDALGRIGTGEASRVPTRPRSKIRSLLAPDSIAIVGVSTRMNLGHIILRNLLAEGFDARRIHVVKPDHAQIDGCTCVPSLRDLPTPVDVLVVCVDAEQVPALLEECVRVHATESVILIPGGLGESAGSESTEARARGVVAASRSTPWEGLVVNGGNCLGIRSVPGRFNTLFIPRHKLRFRDGDADPVALISQSGAFAVARCSQLPWLNPRYVVTLGNQIDLTLGDYLQHLKEDPLLEVVACYVEGFAPLDGLEWLAAAREFTARGGVVILYVAGRTRAGVRAAASHTASIAGDYEVARALAAESGVLVAETIDDFDDLLRLACLLRGKRVSGMRLGALSNAGFECVAFADHVHDFSLPGFSLDTRSALGSLLSESGLETIVDVHNPLDVTPILNDARFATAARAVCADPETDVSVIGCVPLTGALCTVGGAPEHAEDVAHPSSIANRLIRLHRESSRAWIAVVDAGATFDVMARRMEHLGVPTFRSADRALRVFSRYCAHRVASSKAERETSRSQQ